MKTRRPPAQARGCWGWGWGGNNRGNAGNQHFITGMERKKRRKGAPSGAWKTHFNERRQRLSRCLWTIWTRKSHHKSHHSWNYKCNFALFITLAPLLCEYRISSLVFFSIAEQTGQRDAGQLDTLALAWRPSDKCSYFVSISSPHNGDNMQGRREDSILGFVYNEWIFWICYCHHTFTSAYLATSMRCGS